ncbi:probable protein phosphatase 2C 13 [Glycine max]|uniref:protein-serine/threonine phosphatase n=1 Tax=Glycine max TaxID=3847 RepID=G3ECQ8_SOYBN|nr:probable protein phosphatase 2C 13 [Glycine max]AEO14877.1 rfls10 protein [Glycine max]|eukprot:NP_001304629.1 probable protein phosphatase 2C 13 [Glycine max]
MIVSQNMVTEAEIICKQNIPMLDVKKYHLRVAQELGVNVKVVEVSPTSNGVPVFGHVRVSSESVSTETTRFESVMGCSEMIEESIIETPATEFTPNVRSGRCADIGPRGSMDDEHIQIDDLAAHLGFVFKHPMPSAFYAVFDGHGGPDAAAFVKNNAMRLLFEDADMLQSYDADAPFLKKLEDSHRRAFLGADLALADEQSVSSSCGTTALTALVLGRHLMVANAGDCRAVLCRRGVAVDMSQDHRPSYLPERRRVEELGGFIDDGYLNGYLSVTRALGDWDLKLPLGSASPLIAEPDVQVVTLTEDDEFLIIGCDGIWDVISSQDAVSFVRRGLRRHDDPQQCARELVKEALRLHTSDNLTVIVICLSPVQSIVESCPPQRRRFRACSLSEEARNRLRSLLEGN